MSCISCTTASFGNEYKQTWAQILESMPREDTSILKGRGRLGPDLKFREKIWGKVIK